ncbi:MAG: hypothetical protein ACFFD8_07430 [Candidatus Thorarchaeota archaeon]
MLQIYNLGHPIVALYLFTGLWIALLVGLVILEKIGKVSRHNFWRYFIALNIIMFPLTIISLLATLGIIPAGILDSIIRFLDFIWP